MSISSHMLWFIALKADLLTTKYFNHYFLNQVSAGRRPALAWFSKILILCGRLYACVCVCSCVYPPTRLLITSGVIWRDMGHKRLVIKVLQLLYGNCSRYR